MVRITVSKEKMKGREPHPAGIYEFRVSGFKPKLSKNGDSVNLNPVLQIINHPKLNGKRLFFNMNTNAGWLLSAFCNNIKTPMVPTSDGASFDLPGEFNGPQTDPTKWVYAGPMLGRTGKCELGLVDDTKGGQRNELTKFL